MLAKGGSPHAAWCGISALEHAARRQRLAYPAVQTILRARADEVFLQIDLQHLVSSTMELFDDAYGTNDLLPLSESMEEVFLSGPGAVMREFWPRLEQHAAAGYRYESMLQVASAAGQCDLIELLIKRGVDCDAFCSYYGTALQAACRYGQDQIVRILPNANASHMIGGGKYNTALHAAIVGGNLHCVTLLLEAGADTELLGQHAAEYDSLAANKTPLRLAIERKQADIAVALIEKGADIGARLYEQQPLLVETSIWGNHCVFRALLAAGADIQVKGQNSIHPQNLRSMAVLYMQLSIIVTTSWCASFWTAVLT